ncbi:MAG: FAD-binding oxidoreductase [Nitrososphaerota archaeon]|nr:FAD-binding oxidoreductase [Candidatus Calditenuaceae archaeon]MDW8072716.1 FAD-binding oxidoreductase [Nitrososphaerota archaeon]
MYDLAVLGGGVVGCFAALRAAELGLRTILVEARSIFGGASPRSAGVFTVQLDSPLDVELVNQSIELVKKYSKEAWRETGFLQIGREDALEESIESIRRCGINYEVLNDEEIMRRWPIFIVESELIGVYTKHDLSVEPKVLGRELRAALLESGVEVAEEVIVTGLKTDSSEIEAVNLSSGLSLSADYYILALGPWTREILLSSFKDVEVESFILTCFAFRIDTGRDLDIPSFSDEYLHTYWRPWGTTLVGGRYDAEFSAKPDVSDAEPPSKFYRTSLKLLRRRLKLDSRAELVEHMRGPCSFTNDGMPVFGPLSGLKNAFIIEGLGGYGLMRGPALGYRAAEALALNRELTEFKHHSPTRILRPKRRKNDV